MSRDPSLSSHALWHGQPAILHGLGRFPAFSAASTGRGACRGAARAGGARAAAARSALFAFVPLEVFLQKTLPAYAPRSTYLLAYVCGNFFLISPWAWSTAPRSPLARLPPPPTSAG